MAESGRGAKPEPQGEDVVRASAEDALRESEERFRTIFERAALGIGITDLAGRWLRANPWLCAMLGYSADELAGVNFRDITHADDLAVNLRLHEELMAGLRPAY